MDVLLLIVLFLMMAVIAIMISPCSFPLPEFLSRIGISSKRVTQNTMPMKPRSLDCRVKLKEGGDLSHSPDTFSVEISGSIHAEDAVDNTFLRISILDITDGLLQAKPVYNSTEEPQISDSPVLCYEGTLGKLREKVTTIPQWMPVAQLNVEQLMFPRRGQRNLRVIASILSNPADEQLAYAACTFVYENPRWGYIDTSENDQCARTMAVPIAFVIGSTGNKLCVSQTAAIKKWEKNNLYTPQAPDSALEKLKRIFRRAVYIFCIKKEVKLYKNCRKIASLASIGVRYDIIDFFLCVTQANGTASAGQLALLTKLANWLEVDHKKFRSMREKTLPANIHEAKDVNDILGIGSDMNKGQVRQHLNHEYRKWNAITVNCDPEIQAQAAHMLKLIGETRLQYI